MAASASCIAPSPLPRRRRTLIAKSTAIAAAPAGDVRDAQLVAVNVGGEARPAWRVVVEEKPHEPVAHYIDAATGALLRLAAALRADHREGPRLRSESGREAERSVAARSERLRRRGAGRRVLARRSARPQSDRHAGRAERADRRHRRAHHAARRRRRSRCSSIAASRSSKRSTPTSTSTAASATCSRSATPARGASSATRFRSIRMRSTAPTTRSTSAASCPGRGSSTSATAASDDAEDPDIVLHEFFHAMQDWIAPGAFFGLVVEPVARDGRRLQRLLGVLLELRARPRQPAAIRTASPIGMRAAPATIRRRTAAIRPAPTAFAASTARRR